MKILCLNYEFPPIGGGSSPVSRDLAKELINMGNQVTVVTMAFKDLPSHEIMDGIKVHRVKCIRSKAFVCHPWEQLSYLISGFFFLRKLMKTESFDVVHAHFIIPTGVLAWWMKKKYGIPYIITAHGSDVMGYNQKRFRLLHKLLINPWKAIVKNADGIVSPSEFLDRLIKKQLPDAQSEIIPNGVDTECFKALPKEKYILVMCRLQETKNVQTVIRAISIIEDMRGFQLYIAGDGPYKDTLEKMTEELNIRDRVKFQGWVKNKSELHVSLMGKAAIYVSASHFENSPVSVMEALSAQCQPLLSDIPPHRMLVRNEDCFYEADDAETLADKLEGLMAGEPDYGQSNFVKPENWGTVANKYEVIFSRVIKEKD